MNCHIKKTILWVSAFSIAMGFLESAIVVYLRQLYYPDGFSFPLKIMDNNILITEFLRELATLIMLIGIGIVAGRKNIERFAYFIFSFAIWDIFYYVFLKILLNWPESFFTWDVLFLIPTTWTGPVIAPIINSAIMIFLALIIIYFFEKKKKTVVSKIDWMLLIGGSFIVIYAYTQEYSSFMFEKYSMHDIFNQSNSQELIAYSCSFIPQYFNWWIFATGVFMHIATIIHIITRNKKIPACN